jgi:hypothetical protein
MVGVGGHQSLLDCEHEVVSCVKGGRGHGWVSPTQSELQRMDRFAQARRRFRLILKAEGLDVIEQDIGFGEQRLPMRLCGAVRGCIDGRGGHAGHHKRCSAIVKWTFTVAATLTTWLVAAQIQS